MIGKVQKLTMKQLYLLVPPRIKYIVRARGPQERCFSCTSESELSRTYEVLLAVERAPTNMFTRNRYQLSWK